MKVNIEGVCMDVITKNKDGKQVNYAMIYQNGETQLIKVKLANGETPVEGEKVYYKGRVVAWKWKENVNMMVIEEGCENGA